MPDFIVDTFMSLESNEIGGNSMFGALMIIFIFLCYWGMRLLLPLFLTKRQDISKRTKKIYGWGIAGVLLLLFLGILREKFFPWIDSDMFTLTLSVIIVSGCIYFLLEKERSDDLH